MWSVTTLALPCRNAENRSTIPNQAGEMVIRPASTLAGAQETFRESALAMSANRQATIGRRWGQIKPSQWGQFRPLFSLEI